MAYGYGGWAPYVPVAERRRRAEREMAKLRKKGYPVSPVRIEGRTIARTFWGKSWCENWRAIAIMRTACRAAEPTSGTDRSSISRLHRWR